MQTPYLSLYPTTIDTINTMDTIHIEKRTFPVLDMSCAACAARVDKTLNGQPGVRTASVNYAAATATVEYDTAQCSPEQLKAALQAAGYDLLVGDDRKQLEDRAEQAHDEKYRRLRQRTVWATLRRPHLMGIVHPHRPLVGTGFPPQRLAATAARHGQHGHFGVEQHAHCLRLQPFQHALSGVLDGTGRRASRLFRSGERHHRLYPVGAALGRKSQGQHLDGHPQAHGAATPYGQHRGRPWGNT